jgi:site-specific DNA-methyltransferase (adenine-specific)
MRRDLAALAEEIELLEQESRTQHQRPIELQISIGERLLEAKRTCRHGEFLVWLEEACHYDERHARRLMTLALNRTRVSDLDPGVSLRGALSAIKDALDPERPRRSRSAPGSIELPEDLPYRIEVADAADLPLPDGIVDLTVTSPPYGLDVDYADGVDVADHAPYLELARSWAAEIFRVTKPDGGRLCLNVPLDTTRGGQRPVYADWWCHVLAAVGWTYQTTIVWAEGNVSRHVARGSVASTSAPHVITPVEMIIVCHRGRWNLGRIGSHNLTHDAWLSWTNGLWTFPGDHSSEHPAPFPEELPRRCMSLFSFIGDVILDPFVGSGTTAIVAHRLGRTMYGFDRSPQYVALARQRLAQEIAA